MDGARSLTTTGRCRIGPEAFVVGVPTRTANGEISKLVVAVMSAVDGHGVAVGVGEGERATERAVERLDHDSDAGQDQCIVQILRIVRLQPDGDAPPEMLDGVEVDGRLPKGERDGLCGEDHRVVRAHRSTSEAEVLGVERCGSLQVANLESDEVGAEYSHDVSSWTRVRPVRTYQLT